MLNPLHKKVAIPLNIHSTNLSGIAAILILGILQKFCAVPRKRSISEISIPILFALILTFWRRIRTKRAVLTAIAIPVFTSQLEKSREATDQANIRSAYADVMAQFLTNADSGKSMTVSARQVQEGWQGPVGTITTQVDGVESQIQYSAKINGNNYTVSINTSGVVTIN